MISTRRAIGGLLLLAAAVRAAAVSDAPLGVGTPGPFRGLFLELPLSDARGAGAPTVEARWWLANDWSVPTRLRRGDQTVLLEEDAQGDALQLTVTVPWDRLLRAAWAGRVESRAELRATVWWGGWTDRPIERWHEAIGSWNFERQLHAPDVVGLRMGEEGGKELADVRGSRFALGDLALRTQVRLAAGQARGGAPTWAIALRADLKLPTGRLRSLGGSGGVDGGLGLAGTWAPARWFTGHLLGDVRLVSGLPRGFPLQPRTVQWGVDLSLVFRIAGRVALVVEDRLSSPLFEGSWKLAEAVKEPEATAYYVLFRPHNQLSGGVRVGEVTVFFSEDFTPGRRLATDPGPGWFYNSNGPDFVLGLSWARRL